MTTTSRQTGMSSVMLCCEMGSFSADTRSHSGRIRHRSMMFAPMMLPAERLDCFLMMEVTVVTSSGREVPTATSVTAMMLSGTPR